MTTPPTWSTAKALAFGRFRLVPEQALLLDGEVPCRLGGRAMAILIALVERAGEIVTKQALLARAWPDALVHEANLRMHVAALRKQLGNGQGGARFITNVTGRGYCFIAPLQHVEIAVPGAPTPPASRPHNLPALLTHVVGRAQAIETIALQVPMRRCVTIVGPGGIGKTTVAVAAAARLLPVYDDGVWFVDLATVSDPQLIPFGIASLLGLSLQAVTPLPGLIAFLRDRRLLLVLDNCEHLVEAVAVLTERLLRDAPHVGILATSRESLRTEGEWLHRLGPIGLPPEGATLTAAQALAFPSVQLFVAYASASLEGFEISDADAPVVGAICRRLDGLPLAIELAALRIDLFGLHGLANVLNEQFLLVSQGRRTALPRQQSLVDTLEWSYRLLSPVEQCILRRLSVFRRDFTLEAAVAVAGGDGVAPEQVYAGVLTLSAKSLVITDTSDEAPQHQHRLLHVTRAFVSQKLQASDDARKITRRHAAWLCRLLAQAETDWDTLSRADWLATYARSMDDVRCALDWAFSRDGDPATGVALTALALPLGLQLSLIDEFRGRVERALLHCGRGTTPQPLAEMRLNIALGDLTHNTSGPVPGPTVGLERAVELSRQLERRVHQVEPLIGLATLHLGTGDYAVAVAVAREAGDRAAAAGDPMACLAADRLMAQAHHFDGNHCLARELARRVMADPAPRLPLAYNPMPVDRHVAMRIVLARIAWLEGWPDQAAELVRESLVRARADNAFSLCPTLTFAAIPIALWTGDDPVAGDLTAALAEQATRFSLGYWQGWAAAFGSLLNARAGVRDAPAALSGALQSDTFPTFSVDLLNAVAAMRADNGAAGWCQPEIRRVQGEWLLAEGTPGAAAAAGMLFQEAIDRARTQGALSWELRAVTSLARLWQHEGRTAAARDALAVALGRFREGHGTADLRAAAALLGELSGGLGGVRRAVGRKSSFLQKRSKKLL